MLCRHISVEAVELVVAQLFIDPRPFIYPPNSSLVGFERFLGLLGSYDWDGTPFIIDTAIGPRTSRTSCQRRSFVAGDYEAIGESFRDSCEAGTGPAMFIVTPDDRGGVEERFNSGCGDIKGSFNWRPFWARVRPSKAVLKRIADQSRESLRSLESNLLNTGPGKPSEPIQWMKLFSCECRRDCDALMILDINVEKRTLSHQWSGRRKVAPSAHCRVISESSRRNFVNLESIDHEMGSILVDFDIVSTLVEKIEHRFGHLLLLFFDHIACKRKRCNTNGVGELHVSLIWRPLALLPVHFQLGCCRGVLPVSVPPTTHFVPNLTEVLMEILLMANGIITRIELL